VARVISLLVCLQFSGVERGLIEGLVFVQAAQVHCDDCEDDTPDDCPPGCPACHCTSPVLAMPQASLAFESLEFRERSGYLTAADDRRVPAAPYLAGVFRPPRASNVDG
jgi:hypothetical protein